MKNTSSGFWLTAMLCLAGVALMFVPIEAARPLRCLVRDALRPGLAVVHVVSRQCRAWAAAAENAVKPGARPGAPADDLRRIRLENRRLELHVASLREKVEKLSAQQGLIPAADSPGPLVSPKLVEARVLGEETAAQWRGRKLLSTGTSQGVSESALVLEDTRPLIDLGSDARLSPGDAAYAGRIVIGKIAEVGRYSSTLRLVTDTGYSGRARLARRTSRGLVFGAEGTLAGDGSELCRLNHMTEPVNIDDEVFSGGADGLVPRPMYYGKVVRAELEEGASEWSVWVKPAASEERLESVLILRRAINEDRILAD